MIEPFAGPGWRLCLRVSLCVLVGAGAACGAPIDGGPQVSSVTPTKLSRGNSPTLTVLGHFYIVPSIDFVTKSLPSLADTFEVYVGSVACADVAYVGPSTLHATVPASLGLGVYDVSVLGPSGLEGVLQGAITVTP